MSTNYDVIISKINETWIRVKCSEVYQELDLQDRFSFKIKNAQHDPRVKKHIWDGVKKLYNRRDQKMYLGLLLELLSFCESKGWSVKLDEQLIPDNEHLSVEDIDHLTKELFQPKDEHGNLITVSDYQYEAVEYMLNMNRTISLAATSSGKSLMIYLSTRIYQMLDEYQDKKILIIVPSINLVEQMFDDFKNYSQNTGWNVHGHCQKVSKDYSKTISKQIIISTWQSIKSLQYDVLDDIGVVFVDEVHTASASVLTNILESLTKCKVRHGLTGTLNGMECDELVVQGLLGPAKRIITARELIDIGRATEVKVNMVVLDHNKETVQEYISQTKKKKGREKYEAEVQFLNHLESRNKFILDIVSGLTGNTLVLFDRVDEYGKILYERYTADHPDTSFLIVGEVEGKSRENIRLSIEDHENAVIWASFGTMSTGVSIKKMHNLVIISSNKSKIRTLQSIGRMMRLHFTKESANIYDLVDNLTVDDQYNYVMNHAIERINYYKTEQFDLDFIRLDL